MKDTGYAQKYNWKNKRILIVEDEEINNMFFDAALSRTESKLLWAKNGKEAVDIIEASDNIDVILMDIRLPIMDGCEATRRIKKNHKTIPIIAQTAYALEGDKERILDAGCDDYLSKPIRFEELLATIDKYLAD
ncbi:response regulator [Labilibaculum filiforme]|uniref:Response regulator n=1 Tax=Labilibaculum filiforme TaxID=1940526 RepID=A0A2N3HXL9_9BACT|nr:response regulator [Labilibaculum filiforme]PKQ62816.1 response regulator [Labilibaculum filiforme]